MEDQSTVLTPIIAVVGFAYFLTGQWVELLLPAVQWTVANAGSATLTLVSAAIGLGFFMLATREAL